MVGSNIKTMVWETMLLGNRARNSMAAQKVSFLFFFFSADLFLAQKS